MADDTTDGSGTGNGTNLPDPDVTKKAAQMADESAAPAAASDPAQRPLEPHSDSAPPTEQWAPRNTAEYPRAYSRVSEATTTPVTPPPAAGTAAFPTGANPADEPLPNVANSDGADATPPTGPGVVTSAPGRRRKGPIIAISAVGVVLVVVIALIGSELFFRHRAADCLEQQFNDLTGQSTTVGLSKKPVLLQYFSGSFPYVQVDTTDSSSTKMQLHLRADDLTKDGDSVKVGSLTGTGNVPFQRVIDLSKQSGGLTQNGGSNPNGGTTTDSNLLASTQIESAVGNPTDGTIKVDALVPVTIFSVPVSITVKPVVDQGKVAFKVERASAFVFGIPADFAQQFVDGFGDSLFSELTDSIKVQSLKVTESGVDFTVTGSDVDLNQSMGSRGGSKCSIL